MSDIDIPKAISCKKFHGFLSIFKYLAFPCKEVFSVIFHVFQSLWEPCIISTEDAIPKILRLQLWSEVGQAGLNLTWMHNPKDRFSNDTADILTTIDVRKRTDYLRKLRNVSTF